MPGIGEFLGGIGKILGKIPIQDRQERWRNEVDNLTKEKNEILSKPPTVKLAKRITDIDKRIAYLQQLQKNAGKE